MDPKLKQFFSKAGVSERELQDKDTRDFIYDFIDKHGGIEAALLEVPIYDFYLPYFLNLCPPLNNLPLKLRLGKHTNKTGGLYISFKIQQSALVIGQRPNLTIANYSASADCKTCSFGHCLPPLNSVHFFEKA